MKLTLAEPKYLKDSITVISDLVGEAKFSITKDSIELIAMDPANVAMVIFKLLSSAFTDYDVKEDMEIAINLANLKQVLGRSKGNDTVTLETDDGKGMLTVTLQGNSTRTFSLPLIDTEEKVQRVPDLKFPVNVKMDASALSDGVDDVDVVADSVTLAIDTDRFMISAEGDLSKAKVEIPADDNTKITCDSEVVKSKYSIEYLKKIIKGSKVASDVEVHFNKDYPLRVDYKAADKVMLSFILAPRVEND